MSDITVYKNISEILTLQGAHEKDGRKLLPEDKKIISQGAVVFNNDEILWVGPEKELPNEYDSAKSVDMAGAVLTPEIVDSHTHLVFGGNRSFEYSMRLDGKSYVDIAEAGGGILNTMKGTNEATKDALLHIGRERIKRLQSYGVGTIEIKSGYGLNYEKEKELSLVIDQLKKEFAPKVQIVNTYMAAHAVPKSFEDSRAYLDEVVISLMKELAPMGVIDCVDIFHEVGYFDYSDTEYFFKEAKKLNLKIKSHADEFNDNKGAILAAQYGALSTDHLLCTGDDGIEALANSNTVANLLPGTGFYLGEEQVKARKFLDAGVKVGIGSDYNPGSCHWDNVLMIASMSAMTYGMNSCELWAAITYNAAAAIGVERQGVIAQGMKPRFTKFNIPSIAEITYGWGKNFAEEL
jgi:imidazolonepropionase